MSDAGASRRNTIVGLVAIGLPVVIAIAVAGLLAVDDVDRPSAPAGSASKVAGEFAPIDPRLITYAEIRAVVLNVEAPRAVALDSLGRVYVAGARTILRMDVSGEHRTRIPLDADATCLAVADDGTLVIGERTRIILKDARGATMAQWSVPGRRGYVTSVDVRGDEVLVGDAGSRVVLRFDRKGRLRGRIGEADPTRGIEGLNIPSAYMDVAYAEDGAIWVANTGMHRLESYTPDGEITGYFGEPSVSVEGFSGCCNPSHFATMPDGRIVTSEKGLPRTKICNVDGGIEEVVADASAFTPDVLGLDTVVDESGRVLVLDPPAKLLRVFERKVAPGAHEKDTK
jgi:hypothetical protein